MKAGASALERIHGKTCVPAPLASPYISLN